MDSHSLATGTADDSAPTFANTAHFLQDWSGEHSALLFCEADLIKQVAFFQENFPGKTAYAVKANPDAPILNTLYQAGVLEYDAASLGEIEHLRKLLPDATINFNNPIRTARDLRDAYQRFDVRSFVIDDKAALHQLLALNAKDIEVTIRLKLAHESAAYNFGSKFGASIAEATKLLEIARGEGFATLSMAFHPGSQCSSVQVYEKYIEACASVALAANTQLARLNVGGGFPVAYTNASIPPLEAFFNAIAQCAKESFGTSGPDLLCEPGRAITAASCSLVCRVTHVREDGPVFIGDGVYGCLQEQFLIDSRLPVRLWRNGVQLPRSGPERDVFGPTCDPSDKLAARYQLGEDICAGDCVEFGLMGAYSTATATRFNGMEPAQYVRVATGFTD